MAKEIKQLNLGIISLLREDGQLNYVDNNLFISLSVVDFQQKNLQLGQPYRVENGRLVCVTSGWVKCIVNLQEYYLHSHCMLVIPPDSIFEIIEHSHDFDMQAMSLKDLQGISQFGQGTLINADEDQWQLIQEYFNLLWHETLRQPLEAELVRLLQSALLIELKRIGISQEQERLRTASRHETMLHNFIELVNHYGTRERKVSFYADKLCVTQNHLGAVIKQTSGLTIIQWINRHTIQLAKVLLRYTDMPIWEISERLNFANQSFFSKYFKQHTSLTPNQYRKA